MPGSSPGMTLVCGTDLRLCLCRVDQHQLRILQRGDLELGFIADRGAVAGVDPHTVHLDRARGRHQIKVPRGVGRIQIWKILVWVGSRLYSEWRMPLPALIT